MPAIISFVTLQICLHTIEYVHLKARPNLDSSVALVLWHFVHFQSPSLGPCCLHINHSPLFTGFWLRAGVFVSWSCLQLFGHRRRDWPRFPLSTRNSHAVSALSAAVRSMMYNWVIYACVCVCASGAVNMLCFVWKIWCIKFHSLTLACMYINYACNFIFTHQ